MSLAILDARGWQNSCDLKSGAKIPASGPIIDLVKGVLQKHPYPGDSDPNSNRWVSDTALDLIERYRPRFAFLTYAAQYFTSRYAPMDPERRAKMVADLFAELERFVRRSGFAAVVVGTGGLTPLAGAIDATGLDGLVVCHHWSARYAGLYEPSPSDLEILAAHPQVERVVPRREVAALFHGTPEQASRVPDYLMVARAGYTFKGLGNSMKTPVMIPAPSFEVPVSAPGHAVEAITDIRSALEQDLREQDTALIVTEGVALEEFPWTHRPCRNSLGWYCYEPGGMQHLTIAAGKHRFSDYPSGYRYFDEIEQNPDFPFSGYFKSIPRDTIGESFLGRSIAVGNRSMFMHMVAGADIAVECFARNLHNQGTMAVIHRQDK
ncbi:MAG: hypothetical protein JXB25_12505 [Deltaproteobacteria bacterium]|nr:hypothetical protein [Deltaproteobacteria bacterium]